MYKDAGVKKRCIIAAGGAIQKNKVLQRVIADMFGAEPLITKQTAQTANGAALFSAIAAGMISGIEAISEYISYEKQKDERAECIL